MVFLHRISIFCESQDGSSAGSLRLAFSLFPCHYGSSPGLAGGTVLLSAPAGALFGEVGFVLPDDFFDVFGRDVSIFIVPSVAEALLDEVSVLTAAAVFSNIRPSLVKLIMHIVNTANRKTVPKE